MRKARHGKADKRIFRRTAVSAKRVNIDPPIMRGGIRF